MKQIVAFILLLAFFACQNKVQPQVSQEAFQQGMDYMLQRDSSRNFDYHKARQSFRKAVRLDSTNMKAWRYQLVAEMNLSWHDSARQTVQRALQQEELKDHKLKPHFYKMAAILEMLRDEESTWRVYLEKASQMYDERLERDPDREDAWLEQISVLCWLGRKEEALKLVNSIHTEKHENITPQRLEVLRDFIRDWNNQEMLENFRKPMADRVDM